MYDVLHSLAFFSRYGGIHIIQTHYGLSAESILTISRLKKRLTSEGKVLLASNEGAVYIPNSTRDRLSMIKYHDGGQRKRMGDTMDQSINRMDNMLQTQEQ